MSDAPAPGICPVRGHSNVQGDRTVGITEKPTVEFLEQLEKRFGFKLPRAHGHDVVLALEAMVRGEVKVFVALGGNFAAAVPDWQRATRHCANSTSRYRSRPSSIVATSCMAGKL